MKDSQTSQRKEKNGYKEVLGLSHGVHFGRKFGHLWKSKHNLNINYNESDAFVVCGCSIGFACSGSPKSAYNMK